MNCIYCNNPIVTRRKGDHIIPQGLGKFTPELRVNHICKECDSRHGNEFERIALRTGMIAVFRSVKGIKSRNNRRQPIHSPSLDKFQGIESQEFAMLNTNKPYETVYIAGSGAVRFANTIVIKKDGALLNSIEIPPTRDIAEMCNFIEAMIPGMTDDLEYELDISEEQMDDVLKELRNRGKKLDEPYRKYHREEFSILKISSILTENHFRFVASTILKGMIYLGYGIDLLRPLIEYVKTGDINNLIYRYIDFQESGMDTRDNPPLKLFYHTFEWRITENSIAITASLLAHKNVNGIRMKLSTKAGNDNAIIIPYGKIIARYGDTQNDGLLEIFHGDHKIEVTGKPRGCC
ncbi:hypothetical protein [Macellibacteroides fermentans]|uniref:hypothetical protein n=1 Tax=Macellibacteroides fermentans TaxID=879969 RepID=UPI00406C1627